MKITCGKLIFCGNRALALSDVLREAMDERFDRLNRSRKAGDVTNIMQDIFELYPDPVRLPPRAYNVHDRKAARTAIVEKFRHGAQ